MAHRGSKKELSVRHERFIATLFNGRRSPSSGASSIDKGDVSTDSLRIECKMSMTGRLPTIVKQFEKIREEAYERGCTPILALRYYDPSSKLADDNGWIDLCLSRAKDLADWTKVDADA